MDFVWNKGEEWDITYAIKPRPNSDGNYGLVAAINLETRQLQWVKKHRTAEASAVLSTKGGLIFEGGRDDMFRASDSLTGQVLWQSRLDNKPSSTPITFAAGGKQYVAVTTGGGNPNDALQQSMTPEFETPVRGTTLLVFGLGSDPATITSATTAPGPASQ
jgi:alcohol dehydrogenase (cytochrome c)